MEKVYRAVYRYYVRDFRTDKLTERKAPCLIVGETARSYRITLPGGNNRRMPNDPFWVRRRSVVERSYFDEKGGRCEIYSLNPDDRMCRGCLNKCLRSKVILENEK